MDDQNKNLILATVLSFVVILTWYVAGPMLFPQWFPTEEVVQTAAPSTTTDAAVPPVAGQTSAVPATGQTAAEAAVEAPRLTIDTDELAGSISLQGGRIDDLSLKTYTETIQKGSPNVRLLSPVGQAAPYYALFGWQPSGDLTFDDVPGANTPWQIRSGATLSVDAPVTLGWDNGKGLQFTRTIAIDDKFMFTVTDAVTNTGSAAVRLAPYGVIARHGLPSTMQNIWVVHEGLIGRADGILDIEKYKNVPKLPVIENEAAHAQLVEFLRT